MLADGLARAIERRRALLERLDREGTDCVRLWHGIAEGAAGLTVDRYGPVLLIQTGREPLEARALDALVHAAEEGLGVTLSPCWNHRPAFRREGFDRHFACDIDIAIAKEAGLAFDARPRHQGLDPLLFLDLRAGRRRVREIARASVLNLFAYTCGLGVAAAAGGAREVVNVDFARSSLTVGALNAARNGQTGPWMRFVHEDAIPILLTLAGGAPKGRGARGRSYLRMPRRRFDLVALDPPRWAKTPFGAIDVVRDYASLLNPALRVVAPGGHLIATHHVPGVDRAAFAAIVERSARKVGRAIDAVEILGPDEDFPGVEGEPPLKIAIVRLA